MDLNAHVDIYCERLGPGLWAEPVNAATNLAFLVVALVMWRRTGGRGLGGALCVLLALIGLSSGAFHTLARAWAGAADSLSILAFVLVYLYAANRRFLGLSLAWSLFGVAAFVPFAAAIGAGFARVPYLSGSAGYLSLPVLIFTYAIWLRARRPEVARGLAIGGGLLVLSLTFRTLDTPICVELPLGTHFLWHLLNAAMLGWMIEVYRRADAAGRSRARRRDRRSTG